MRKKLTLRAGHLSVDSFPTASTDGARGTVEGKGPCTCFDSCVCPTSRYRCADRYETLYSCDDSVANTSCPA